MIECHRKFRRLWAGLFPDSLEFQEERLRLLMAAGVEINLREPQSEDLDHRVIASRRAFEDANRPPERLFRFRMQRQIAIDYGVIVECQRKRDRAGVVTVCA